MLGINGAQERTRTSTSLPILAPEASASTNSATWAGVDGADVRPVSRTVNAIRMEIPGQPETLHRNLWIAPCLVTGSPVNRGEPAKRRCHVQTRHHLRRIRFCRALY